MLIKNATVVEPDRLVEGQAVLCRGAKIVRVGPELEPDAAGEDVFDAAGGLLAPGYIDLHTHGGHKFLIDHGADELAGLCGVLPRYGVTGLLAGVCPRPRGEDTAFLAELAKVRSEGSQLFGLHLEGPFLTLTGALPPDSVGADGADRVHELIRACAPYRAVFSISPDLPGIAALIPEMTQGGGPVFITHTAADVRQTQAAIEAGARHATHFYDVFPCPPVRDPGVRPCGAVEAVLADPRASVDFILDGEHVDPVAVKMALACKGPDRVCLITDANVGAGLPPGRHEFVGGAEVEFKYEGGPARLTERSRYPGGLAGSGLTMDRAVRNAVSMLGIGIPLAVRMASLNPAKVLGLDDVKGRVRAGYDADLVLLDSSLRVVRTWVGGQCRFSAKEGGTR